MKKKTRNILFVSLSGGFFLYYMLHQYSWSGLVNQLAGLQSAWLLMGFGSMLVYWALDASVLQRIINNLHGRYGFFKAFEITLIGQFFNAITPFASGGQPAQMYALARQEVEVGKTGSILMMKYIIHQVVLVCYALLLIIWKAGYFSARLSSIFYLIFIGFAINACIIGLLFVLSRYRNLNGKISSRILGFLERIRLIKDRQSRQEKIDQALDKFHFNLNRLQENKKLLLQATLLTALRLTFLYLIPYFIYRSFGLEGAQFSTLLAATAFVQLFTAFIPIPGASGGAEGSFYLFFGLFFLDQQIFLAIFIWRLITYYSGMVLGWLSVILWNYRKPKMGYAEQAG
ncbi:MAG: lysylphosphatidylglycerol synthase transmembrane domain-containing protein [Halanaerobium sp.]|nr:lysylphosphatidylglycerol synthase transmembrane domain-containing protein [Halanaerobium sp.]